MLCSYDDWYSISSISLQEKCANNTAFKTLNGIYWDASFKGNNNDSVANKLYAVFCETDDSKDLMIFFEWVSMKENKYYVVCSLLWVDHFVVIAI